MKQCLKCNYRTSNDEINCPNCGLPLQCFLTESQDTVSSCKYCGRVCTNRIEKFKHEKKCRNNPRNDK